MRGPLLLPLTELAAVGDSFADDEPGSRSGEGADSLWNHLARDAQRKAPTAAAGRSPAGRAGELTRRERHTILVVDDSDAARYALARALRAEGFRTVEAAGAAEALKLAEFVSAVVLDVYLPDGHGVEICRVLRARPRTARLPVVHVSAVELEAHHQRAAREAGSDDYFTAPVNTTLLAQRLDELVSGREPPAPA